jgi:hypothetical protein
MKLIVLLTFGGLLFPVFHVFFIMSHTPSQYIQSSAQDLESDTDLESDADPAHQENEFQTSFVHSTRWITPFPFLKSRVAFGHHVFLGRIGLISVAVVFLTLGYSLFFGADY